MAARFRHYENRDGQPLLHDHVVLSGKVRRLDDACPWTAKLVDDDALNCDD
ncbi:relaxase domain-containing protein (plasmid) [Streptomyces sp. NBC_01463]